VDANPSSVPFVQFVPFGRVPEIQKASLRFKKPSSKSTTFYNLLQATTTFLPSGGTAKIMDAYSTRISLPGLFKAIQGYSTLFKGFVREKRF
jgi:hypothetical protein